MSNKSPPRLHIELDPFRDLKPNGWPKYIRADGKWATEKQIRELGFFVPPRLVSLMVSILEKWALTKLERKVKTTNSLSQDTENHAR
jgi:hypothetical protein